MSGEPAGPILVGFSGGGDSRALLQRAIETAGGRTVVAAIIDHSLRQNSNVDAERAAAMAREAGAEAEVLTLDWPQDPTPSQAAARAGRMYALTALARKQGARSIFLGHTMDDQAETVLMRAVQGSGWRGLAGMAADAPAPLWPQGRRLRLRRPMLNLRRAAVREALKQRGIDWIDDPSNEAARFMRVRARHRLTQWEGGPLGVTRWAGLAARVAPLAAGLDGAADALIRAAAQINQGTVTLDPVQYREAKADVRQQALAAIVVAAAGASGVADWDKLDRLDAALLIDEARGGTLGGARYARRGSEILFTRDPGAVMGRPGVLAAPPVPLKKGEPLVWDGRVELIAAEANLHAVSGPEGARPMIIAADGRTRLTLLDAAARGLVSAEWLLEERISHLLWR